MTEFTKDIQTLTQQASSSPQLQTNTGSLGSDLINAASFGLGLYRKNKAATELAGAQQQQADYQTKISEGIMAFRDFKINMKAQNVNAITYARKEAEFFKNQGGGAAYAQAVVTGTNKLTGTNTLDEMSAKDKEAQARYDAYQEREIQGEGFAGSVLGLTTEKVNNASPEQKQEWAQESKVFQAEIEGYKAAQSVNEGITQSFLAPAIAVNRNRMNGLLESVEDAWGSGDIEGAETLAKSFNVEVNQMMDGAQAFVKSQMESAGKGTLYNAGLVSDYVKTLGSKLTSPVIQDVLSGAKTDKDAKNKAKAVLASGFSNHFVNILERVQEGTASATDIDDFENFTEYYLSVDVTGLSVTGSNFGGTLQRSVTSTAKMPPVKKAVKAQEAVENVTSTVKNSTQEEIKTIQSDISNVIEKSLKLGRPVSEKNIAWMFESLKTGVNDTTAMKEKGGSKALLEGPLRILTHPNYKTEIASLVENYAASGVDVTQVVSQSLDIHIRNNFYNAFMQLATSATTPYSDATKVSRDKNRPITGKSTYNVKDDVEIKTTANGIMFGYKKGVVGVNTDIGRIKHLQRLNNSTKTINQYLTALSNVSGVEKKEWSDSLKMELDSMFGLAPSKDKPSVTKESPSVVNYDLVAEEQGVDVSTMQDGEYEDAGGVTVIIKAGKIVEVR